MWQRYMFRCGLGQNTEFVEPVVLCGVPVASSPLPFLSFFFFFFFSFFFFSFWTVIVFNYFFPFSASARF